MVWSRVQTNGSFFFSGDPVFQVLETHVRQSSMASEVDYSVPRRSPQLVGRRDRGSTVARSNRAGSVFCRNVAFSAKCDIDRNVAPDIDRNVDQNIETPEASLRARSKDGCERRPTCRPDRKWTTGCHKGQKVSSAGVEDARGSQSCKGSSGFATATSVWDSVGGMRLKRVDWSLPRLVARVLAGPWSRVGQEKQRSRG